MRKLKHACVDFVGGVPTLLIDGQPYGPMTYQWGITYDKEGKIDPAIRERLTSMGKSGVKLYFLRINIDDPNKLDGFMDELRSYVEILRECVPGAMSLIWFVIRTYEEFSVKYPDDILVFNDGSTGQWSAPESMGLTDRDTPRHTFASEIWKKEVGGMLREVVRRVSDSDLAETIVGYFFFPHSYEFSYYGDYDHSKRCLDYSVAMQNAFRWYLAGKYHGDVHLLRQAWKDDNVTFSTAQLPTMEQKTTPDYGFFWDPAQSTQTMDYAECHNEVVTEKLEYFSRICKEESNYHALVGSFWGYFQNQDLLWGGQTRVKRLMDCPYLDFWAAPFTYENKQAGDYASMRYMVKSLQKHGKLYFAEADTFIHDSPISSHIHHGFPMNTYTQSENLLKRDFVYPLCEGTQSWWIDWSSGDSQYKESEFAPLMRCMQRIGASALRMPRGSASEIAALIDQESLLSVPIRPHSEEDIFGKHDFVPAKTAEEIHQRFPFDLMSDAIDRFRIHELPRIGTPVEYFETDDVLEGSSHKVYIFMNQYCADEAEREKINKNLKKDGNTLIFMYGAGLIRPDGKVTIGPENVSELTGMTIKTDMCEQRARMKVVNGASQIVAGLRDEDEIGDFERLIDCGFAYRRNGDTPFKADPNRINPVLYVDDEDAVVLGRYMEGDRAGFAMKKFENWTSFYIGSPAVQAYVLRSIARMAGAHLYVDDTDTIVYANESFVALHTKTAGTYTVCLPQKANIVEAFEAREVAQNALQFEEYIPAQTTKLYCLHPELMIE